VVSSFDLASPEAFYHLTNYKYRLFPLLKDVHIPIKSYSQQYARGFGNETTSKIRPATLASPKGSQAMDATMRTPFAPPLTQQPVKDNFAHYLPYTLADDKL
jgi:hypothetical protein